MVAKRSSPLPGPGSNPASEYAFHIHDKSRNHLEIMCEVQRGTLYVFLLGKNVSNVLDDGKLLFALSNLEFGAQ